MDNFMPITINTQDEMDNLFKERLTRERQKYDGYMSPKEVEGLKAGYDKQIADLNKAAEAERAKYANFDKQIQERDAKIARYETDSVKTRLAHEAGLPYGSTKYIQGTTEEEIKASIADFQSFTKSFAPAAPLASSEPKQTESGARMNALKKLNESLHKE